MTLSLLEHGESRKEPRRPIRTLSSRLRKLERSVKRLQKGFKEIDRHRKHVRKISKELDRSTKQLQEWSQNSHALHEVVIRTAVLPRVAAVVYNAMFETGMGLRPRYNDGQQDLLETDDSSAADIGMYTPVPMETFANSLPGIIDEPNTTMNGICGDDVVAVLPFASADVGLVLTRGFELLFGIPPSEWGSATEAQRQIRIEA